MTRVTLTITSPNGEQTFTASQAGRGAYVLPLIFRTVNAALATHGHEVAALQQAMGVIADFLRLAGMADEGHGERTQGTAGPGGWPTPAGPGVASVMAVHIDDQRINTSLTQHVREQMGVELPSGRIHR